MITETSLALFLTLARDADNWGGNPLLDITSAQRGNLTQLKTADLLSTFRDEGCDWVSFTDAGKALAAEHGIDL